MVRSTYIFLHLNVRHIDCSQHESGSSDINKINKRTYM
jgi:hypothetical protein